jgi:hypothetical protein
MSNIGLSLISEPPKPGWGSYTEQVSQDSGQDSQNRAGRTGQPEKDRTGQLEQDSHNRTVRTEQNITE